MPHKSVLVNLLSSLLILQGWQAYAAPNNCWDNTCYANLSDDEANAFKLCDMVGKTDPYNPPTFKLKGVETNCAPDEIAGAYAVFYTACSCQQNYDPKGAKAHYSLLPNTPGARYSGPTPAPTPAPNSSKGTNPKPEANAVESNFASENVNKPAPSIDPSVAIDIVSGLKYIFCKIPLPTPIHMIA
ncbi:hypothetical protein AA313_de0205538 [Arthrobotrys entomopaga]|nr:hypothetical protein AA313_de0205538 [Arthrobotrys entomopaga]